MNYFSSYIYIHATARQAFTHRLCDWGIVEANDFIRQSYQHMAQLLNYPNTDKMMRNFSEEDYRTLEMLNGPHGWALYKALLIRRGMK